MRRALAGATVASVVLLFYSGAVEAAQSINWTFYGPGAAGKMQGGMTAARKGPDGSNVIRTLDDVRMGKSKWITLASASSMYGRWFCIGTVTFTSPLDRKTHTLEHVVGYVHDTGCAFNGTCSRGWLPQFSGGRARPDKMDIPVGNFSGWGAGPAMNFITGNPNRAARTWQQIAGLPTGQPTGQGSACGGEPRESGMPVDARYNPSVITDAGEQRGLFGSSYPFGQPQPVGYPQQIGTPQQVGTPATVGTPMQVGQPGITGTPVEIGRAAEGGIPSQIGTERYGDSRIGMGEDPIRVESRVPVRVGTTTVFDEGYWSMMYATSAGRRPAVRTETDPLNEDVRETRREQDPLETVVLDWDAPLSGESVALAPREGTRNTFTSGDMSTMSRGTSAGASVQERSAAWNLLEGIRTTLVQLLGYLNIFRYSAP